MPQATIRQDLRWLVAAAVLARLVVPVVAWLTHGSGAAFVYVDGPRYLELAGSLLHHARFATSAGPEVFRVPGYPLWLALPVATGHPVVANAIANACLGAVTVAVIYLSMREIIGRQGARAAGWCCALDGTHVVFSGMVYAEPLLAAMVAIVASAGLSALRSRRPSWVLIAAAVAAASSYVKPAAILLGLWSAVSLAIPGRSRVTRIGLALAGALAVAVVIPGMWILRNDRVVGFRGFSTQIAAYAVYAAGAATEAEATSTSFGDARERLRSAQGVPATARSPSEWVTPGMGERFLRTFLESPGALLQTQARGVFETIAASGADQLLLLLQGREGHRLAKYALRAMYLPVLGLALLGLLGVSSAVNRRERGWIASLLLYFLLVSGGPFGGARFRVPMVPLIAMLAGIGYAGLAGFVGRHRSPRPATAAVNSPDAGAAISPRLS